MNILTFDLEDWFHILDNQQTNNRKSWDLLPSRVESMTEILLDLLSEKNQRATFFVLGYIAKRHPDLIRKISTAGHEIASHGDQHQLVYDQSREQFEWDINCSIDAINDACGIVPKSYRAPGFSIKDNNFWALDILHRLGIEVDCSIFPAKRQQGGIQNFAFSTPFRYQLENGETMMCFPLNTATLFGVPFVFSGGGYFRFFPERILLHYWSSSDYNMTYFHPRDFDPSHPEIPGLSGFRKWKANVGRSKALSKLSRILDCFEFYTLTEAVERTDWSSTSNFSWDKTHTSGSVIY